MQSPVLLRKNLLFSIKTYLFSIASTDISRYTKYINKI